jgi:hypothetical protein
MWRKPKIRRNKMSQEWKLNGTYFEACNCDAACPCIFLSDPTEDDCTVLVAWHIDEGNYNGVALDDLNVGLAVLSPGNMAAVKWQAAVYFDDRATDSQKNALTKIFTGQAGGHPAALVSHVGEVLGISSLPMTYKADGKQRSLQITGVADAKIEAMSQGQGGADITVENHPLCIAPGYAAVVSKSEKVTYKDHDFDWEFTGKNGLFSPFTYQGV